MRFDIVAKLGSGRIEFIFVLSIVTPWSCLLLYLYLGFRQVLPVRKRDDPDAHHLYAMKAVDTLVENWHPFIKKEVRLRRWRDMLHERDVIPTLKHSINEFCNITRNNFHFHFHLFDQVLIKIRDRSWATGLLCCTKSL